VPRKKSKTLTEAELRLMEVLWEQHSATVTKIVEALPKSSPLAYSSVLTTLRILERKGYIKHTKEGRAFVYQPLINREDARRSAVKHLINRFFDNSPRLLVLNMLEQETFNAQELEQLKGLIEGSE
jgi:predicted transcriptional regulator